MLNRNVLLRHGASEDVFRRGSDCRNLTHQRILYQNARVLEGVGERIPRI